MIKDIDWIKFLNAFYSYFIKQNIQLIFYCVISSMKCLITVRFLESYRVRSEDNLISMIPFYAMVELVLMEIEH